MWLEVLRQEHAEVLLSSDQASQRVAHVLPWIDAELATRGDDGKCRRCALRADVVSDKQPCFATQHPRSEPALDLVVGQVHARVSQEWVSRDHCWSM